MLEILTVAGLATFEVYAAIPAGFAFDMHPFSIFLWSALGGLVGVFVAAFLGDRIRAYFRKDKPVKEKKPGLAHRLWEKYGIIGLGLFGTMSVGARVSVAVGVGFNAPLKKLVTWCCVGVLVRCAVFTAVGHYGLQMF